MPPGPATLLGHRAAGCQGNLTRTRSPPDHRTVTWQSLELQLVTLPRHGPARRQGTAAAGAAGRSPGPGIRVGIVRVRAAGDGPRPGTPARRGTTVTRVVAVQSQVPSHCKLPSRWLPQLWWSLTRSRPRRPAGGCTCLAGIVTPGPPAGRSS